MSAPYISDETYASIDSLLCLIADFRSQGMTTLADHLDGALSKTSIADLIKGAS